MIKILCGSLGIMMMIAFIVTNNPKWGIWALIEFQVFYS